MGKFKEDITEFSIDLMTANEDARPVSVIGTTRKASGSAASATAMAGIRDGLGAGSSTPLPARADCDAAIRCPDC